MNLTLARSREVLRLIRRPLSVEEITTFQNERLRALVSHAAAEVPYYRAIFERAGLRVEAVRGTADLRRIPVLTKADLRALPESARVARGVVPERLVTHFTGGSTGEPVRIRRTRGEELLLGLLRMRAEHAIGVRTRDVRAHLTEASMRTRRMLPRGVPKWDPTRLLSFSLVVPLFRACRPCGGTCPSQKLPQRYCQVERSIGSFAQRTATHQAGDKLRSWRPAAPR